MFPSREQVDDGQGQSAKGKVGPAGFGEHEEAAVLHGQTDQKTVLIT